MFLHHEVVEPFAENSWLVGDPKAGEAVLVDPGGHVPTLLARATAAGLRVVAVWLTHAHLDHVSGVAAAVEALGVPVLLHPDDLPLYLAVDRQAAMFGLSAAPPPPADASLHDGRVLELGGLAAHVLHLPGHSPGHVAFWFPAARIVLSGDVLFAGSVGRTDLPGGSWQQLSRSIHERLLPLGDDVRVLPGHGPETTLGRERLTNPFLQAR